MHCLVDSLLSWLYVVRKVLLRIVWLIRTTNFPVLALKRFASCTTEAYTDVRAVNTRPPANLVPDIANR